MSVNHCAIILPQQNDRHNSTVRDDKNEPIIQVAVSKHCAIIITVNPNIYVATNFRTFNEHAYDCVLKWLSRSMASNAIEIMIVWV